MDAPIITEIMTTEENGELGSHVSCTYDCEANPYSPSYFIDAIADISTPHQSSDLRMV